MSKKFHAVIFCCLIFMSNCLIFLNFHSTFGSSRTGEYSYTEMNAEPIDFSVTTKTSPISNDLVNEAELIRGAQKFAVICVEPSDDSTHRWTIPEFEDLMEIINQFYINTSYGMISIDYDVYGFYDLGHNWDHYGGVEPGTGFLIVNDWLQVIRAAMFAADSDIDYDNYDYIIVFINGAFWRGWASIGNNIVTYTLRDGFNIFGVTLCGENPVEPYSFAWGRVAHEIGHMFGLEHTHGSNDGGTKNYESWYSLMARAYPSALNFYSHRSNSEIEWFPKAINQILVNTLDSGTFHVRPRHLDYDGIIQALKVKITNSKYYMVEVIENQGEDAWLPDDGVYIYLVDRNEPNDDECTDMDSTPTFQDVRNCLYGVSDTFIDAANGITISVDSVNATGFEISVINAGQEESDLHINQGRSYESADIWCDSPVNGYFNYRHLNERDEPDGFGDEPLLNDPTNRLYARVHNIGEISATDVVVKFYHKQPMGIGLQGTWSFIGETTIDVPHGQFRECWVNWHPQYSVSTSSKEMMSIHSCIKVVIEQDISEIDTWNNEAQESINFFEVVPSKDVLYKRKNPISFSPVEGIFTIYNPLKDRTNFYISILQEYLGWEISSEVNGQFIELEPYEAQEFEITITPGTNITFKDEFEGQIIASYNHTGDYDIEFIGDIHFQPIGGITIRATLQYQTNLEIDASIQSSTQFSISGNLNFLDDIPSNEIPLNPLDRIVYVKIIDKYDSEHFYNATLVADSSGNFETTFSVPKGIYKVNAYYAGLKFISSSASVTLMVDLENNSIWTSGLFPGFGLFIALGAIVVISSTFRVLYKKVKK